MKTEVPTLGIAFSHKDYEVALVNKRGDIELDSSTKTERWIKISPQTG